MPIVYVLLALLALFASPVAAADRVPVFVFAAADAGLLDSADDLKTLLKPASRVRACAVAGPGAYHRNVEITEYEGTGIVCGWYVCGAYPVTSVVGSRGGWDFGFNLGAGVGFKMGEGSLPSGTTAGTSASTNGNYWPLTFGFRF